jgi:hypothetical protein
MSSTPTDPQQLHAEIAETRADLGATVQALAARTDLKTRAKTALADTTSRARRQPANPKARAALAAGAAILAVGVVMLVRRRRP